jgi:hypothetical protein
VQPSAYVATNCSVRMVRMLAVEWSGCCREQWLPCGMREIVSTADAPSSPLYSQAVKAGGLVYVSGVVGVDVTTGDLAGATIREETRQALANCRAHPAGGGCGMGRTSSTWVCF